MDDDAGDEEAQNPPFTGRWTATFSYDVYMVDTPKNSSDDEEIQSPPTTHFVATVDDLTDMLDYDSDDIDAIDDDAGDEEAQNPSFTGRWKATSSYDVYMVDTPKNNSGDDKENPTKEDPPKTQPK